MVHGSIKDDALRLVQRLPPDATWEDLQYEIYVRQAVDAGLKDSREGKTISLDEVRRQFGLKGPCGKRKKSGLQLPPPAQSN